MFSLPIPILLCLSVLATYTVSIFKGIYSKNVSSAGDKLWLFNLIQNSCCLVGLITIFLCSGKLGNFSAYSMIFGALLSVANVFGLSANLKAFSIGPFSYTTVIIFLGAIIPTVSGLFFGEQISIVQWVGISLMVVCIILSPDRSKGDAQRKMNFKWMLLCLLSAVFAGSVGVLQKIHQSSEHKSEMAAFLISCFAVSVLVSGLMLIKERRNLKKAGIKPQPMNRAAVWLLPVISGAAFSIPHSLNLFLAGALPSAVVFPIINLCPMILSMVTAIILFRERLSKTRWVGLFVGIAATVLVSGII